MKIKKVFLLFPPCPIPKMFPKRVQMPLGVAYLASSIRAAGIDVKVLDSLIEGWNQVEEIDERNIRFGLSGRQIVDRISEYGPDLVGISCMFSIQAKIVSEIASEIKKEFPDIKIVLGGAHPSAMPEDSIADKNIDYALIGESEATFIELIHLLNRNKSAADMDGICYHDEKGFPRVNPKKKYIENLDALPLPAWDLLPVEKYFKLNRPHGTVTRGNRIIPVITSRGCPAKCVFCSIHPIWGRVYRTRSPISVVGEIEMLVHRYAVQEIQIEDDNMTFNRKRAEEICDLIVDKGIKVSFTAPNGLAVWALDKSLLLKLRKAGFYRLTLAVESGSQHTLTHIIHKPLKIDKVLEIIKDANEIGFDIDVFFVVGFPGETLSEMQKTFDLGRKLDVSSVKYFIATPYPGTELLEIAEKENLLPADFNPKDLGINAVKGNITTEYFTPEILEKKVSAETFKTQIALFKRHPVRYVTGIFRNYLIKDIGATIAFLRQSLKNCLSKHKI
ncbi:B12-binding domain-containing radical SAM protein [bacterium]|jgi:magnesium-protoporphyrin IX monomethyl ester (oxidative) cyclase|nr:B12-binding domain-containing radical SAM protein [bacterium]